MSGDGVECSHSKESALVNKNKRHKGGTKGFSEETFSEQAKTINITALWFMNATRSHIRKCSQEHGNIRAAQVPSKVANQLRNMADRVEAIQTPRPTTVPVTVP
jgi:hypothetical protein